MTRPQRSAALVVGCMVALSIAPTADAATKTTTKKAGSNTVTAKVVKRSSASRTVSKTKVTIRSTIPATRLPSVVNAPGQPNAPTITGSGTGGSLVIAPPSVTFAPTTPQATKATPASAPQNVAATTKAPTTLAPTTLAPTTQAPTTQAPTTQAPTGALNSSNSVVMLGDSITENWGSVPRGFFPGKPYINKGVGGETTGQMLARFNRDVLATNPGVVIILGGINDLAYDATTGATSIPQIESNFAAMIDSARSRGIRVVVAAVTPIAYQGGGMGFFLNRRTQTNAAIRTLNSRLQALAASKGAGFADYFTPLADGNGELQAVYNSDNVHLSYSAYDVLTPVAERAIAQAFNR